VNVPPTDLRKKSARGSSFEALKRHALPLRVGVNKGGNGDYRPKVIQLSRREE